MQLVDSNNNILTTKDNRKLSVMSNEEKQQSFDNNLILLNTAIAETADNKHTPTNNDIDGGLKYNSVIETDPINSLLYLISNTVKYQQEYNNLWIKDYEYLVGSIVSILFYNTDSNSFKLYYFRAKQKTNKPPVLNTYNEDELYFTGNNLLINDSWVNINIDSTITDNNISVKEIKYTDTSITNKSNYKFIKLFDCSNIKNSSINYTLEVSRNKQFFSSNQSINILNNNPAIIKINNIFSTKYSSYYTDDIVINQYGLLGCYLLHDTTNKCIYLAIYGNKELIDSYINVNISYDNSTNKLDLIETSINDDIELESLEAIQIRVNNNNSGEIIMKQILLSNDEIFKQGLIKVTNEDIELTWPYKTQTIKGFKEKYLLCNNKEELIGDYTDKQCSYEKYNETFTMNNYADGNFIQYTPITGWVHEGGVWNNNNDTGVGATGWYNTSPNGALWAHDTPRGPGAVYFKFSRFQDSRSSFNMFNNNKVYYYVALK